MKRQTWGKKMMAVTMAAATLAGTPMTALAGDVTWDPATDLFYYTGGTLSGDQWIHDDNYDWIYFGADGVSLSYCYDKIYPLKAGPNGYLYADKRVRSATGEPGQQPIFSMPSTQKDIRYQGVRQMLDSIPLYPDATTHDPELDAMLDYIFAHIITPEMDTHDKLKACYDFLIINISDSRYEDRPGWGTPTPWAVFAEDNDSSYLDSEYYSLTYILAGEMLQWGDGVCDHFSACFAVMAWKIGVPMYIASGEVSSGAPHNWCQLDGPDGVTYVFDPHIDYLNTLRGSGAISYSRFGATQAQMAGKYKKISAIKDTYNR